MILAKKPEIDLKLIMSKISEYDIYRYEIGSFTIGTPINNPLRKDQDPSLVIYISETGHLFHRDYGDDRYKGGAIDLVMQKYGLNYDRALNKVARDFGIVDKDSQEYLQITSKYTKPVLEMKIHCFIQVHARKWDKGSLQYWSNYGITQDELRANDIYCVKEWFKNHQKQYIAPGELCFAYRFSDGFKIYYPTRTKDEGKWKSSISTSTVENLSALKNCEKILITKARKDRLVLQKYYPCVINVQNETRSCFTEEFISALKGKEVWINFDSDAPGVKNCKIITEEFGYKYINVPKQYLSEKVKDFADLYKSYGDEPIIKHLKHKGFL